MGVHPFILTPMDPSADGARTSQRRREKRVFHAGLCLLRRTKEEPSAVEAYLERAKAFAVEHGKVLGGTLLALVAAALALGGKKKKEVETTGARVAAPAAPVEKSPSK